MADDDALRIDAFGGEDGELLAPHRPLVGVGGDRRAGRLVGARRGRRITLSRTGVTWCGPVATLITPGADAGRADALGELLDEDLGHLGDRVGELRRGT